MDRTDQTEAVTDDDIAEIISQHEAGTNDVLAAYLPIEQQYMAAAQVNGPAIIISNNTTAR